MSSMTHIIFRGAKRSSAAWGGAAAALAVCLPAAAEERAALPDIAQALLDAAYESGDANEIAAVAKPQRLSSRTTPTPSRRKPPRASPR